MEPIEVIIWVAVGFNVVVWGVVGYLGPQALRVWPKN
jgi:hypothetical protein